MSTMSYPDDHGSSFGSINLPRLPELDEMVRRPRTTMTLQYRDQAAPAGTIPSSSQHGVLPRMPRYKSTMSSPTLSSSGSATSTSSEDSGRYQSTATSTAARRGRISVPQKRSASPSSETVYCEECEAEICRDPAKHAKKMKERKARKLQSINACAVEEAVFLYTGWQSTNLQSSGNGNSAGLHSVKIDLQEAVKRLLIQQLGQEFDEALRNGRVPDFRRIAVSIADNTSESDHLREHSLLDFDIAPCERLNPRSSVCKTHGDPNWRLCRRRLVQHAFNENVARRQLELQLDAVRPYSSHL